MFIDYHKVNRSYSDIGEEGGGIRACKLPIEVSVCIISPLYGFLDVANELVVVICLDVRVRNHGGHLSGQMIHDEFKELVERDVSAPILVHRAEKFSPIIKIINSIIIIAM